MCRRKAWQEEFWEPQAAETVLALVTQLAQKAAWLPDDLIPLYARAVPRVSPLGYRNPT